jgi:hypothetical protein
MSGCEVLVIGADGIIRSEPCGLPIVVDAPVELEPPTTTTTTTAAAPLEVVAEIAEPPAAPVELAYTGLDAGAGAAFGTVLLLAGALLTRASNRRRNP